MSAPKQILIVEDEPLITMMLEDVLDALGYGIAATADSVATGLAAVAAGGIDGAILDVNLRGGETSTRIADALVAANVPFLFATGGSGDGIPEAHRGRPTLGKPFTMEGVEQALAAL